MEKIFSEILDNARAEAENAIRVAKKIAAREVEYAEREARERSERYKSENTAELLALRERQSVVRVRENKKRELSQRQAFVEEILKSVLEIFKKEGRAGTLGEKYQSWLKNCFEKAISCFEGEISVFCAKEDLEALRSLARGAKLKEVVALDCVGGFKISDTLGRISVDCTLEAAVKNNEEKWRDLIMRRLEE
ncbi:V-type ATP synthase subunit E [bacterium]|nr:V-type ATP synthase subunit E [bacterium]